MRSGHLYPVRMPFLLAIAAFLASLAAVCSAQGGPPMRTDDPGTAGPGNWEINAAATADRRDVEHVYEAPLLDINYGVGERLQLKFEIPWVFLSTDTVPTKNGLGNSLVGVKWRFYENERHKFELSTYPQLEFNNPNSSADRGLVERGVRFLLPLEAVKTIGPVNFNAEAGYWITEYGSDEWIAGLATGRQVLSRLELLAEIYGTGATDGSEYDLSFGFGGRFKMRPRWLLLFMVGHSLHEGGVGEPHLVGYIGMQIQIPKHRHRGTQIPVGVPETK